MEDVSAGVFSTAKECKEDHLGRLERGQVAELPLRFFASSDIPTGPV